MSTVESTPSIRQHRLNFITHPSVRHLFTPDNTDRDLPFGHFLVHGGVVRLGPQAETLSDRQIGAIALEAIGLDRKGVARIFREVRSQRPQEKRLKAESITDIRRDTRQALRAERIAPLFPYAIARGVMEVYIPSKRSLLHDISETRKERLSLALQGYSVTEIGQKFGVTRAAIGIGFWETGQLVGTLNKNSLLAAAVMEGLFDPRKLLPPLPSVPGAKQAALD